MCVDNARMLCVCVTFYLLATPQMCEAYAQHVHSASTLQCYINQWFSCFIDSHQACSWCNIHPEASC